MRPNPSCAWCGGPTPYDPEKHGPVPWNRVLCVSCGKTRRYVQGCFDALHIPMRVRRCDAAGVTAAVTAAVPVGEERWIPFPAIGNPGVREQRETISVRLCIRRIGRRAVIRRTFWIAKFAPAVGFWLDPIWLPPRARAQLAECEVWCEVLRGAA